MQRHNDKELAEMNQNRTISKKFHSIVSKKVQKLFGFNFWLSNVFARALSKLKQSFEGIIKSNKA